MMFGKAPDSSRYALIPRGIVQYRNESWFTMLGVSSDKIILVNEWVRYPTFCDAEIILIEPLNIDLRSPVVFMPVPLYDINRSCAKTGKFRDM